MHEEEKPLRGTRSEVSLHALRHNLRCFRQAIPPESKLLLVVKADAYGHGIVECARVAEQEGMDWLGVGMAEEGILLRQAGILLPILIFSAQSERAMLAAAKAGLTLPVYSAACVEMANRAAVKAGQPLDVHIKVDSGMNRLGLRSKEELLALMAALEQAPMLRLGGAFTHFADADNLDPAYTRQQFERFQALCALLPEGILLHAAATSGMLAHPQTRLSMVRLGIGAYGYPPVPHELPLQPVLRLLAEVNFVKDVNQGDRIGYGCSFQADRPMRVATLAIGYGDGYHRALSNRGFVMMQGRRCAILGRICMDQMMVDVSGLPDVQPGDEALLLGRRGADAISADELASLAGTISYELLLSLKPRVPRYFVDKEEEPHAEQST